mgnify:CR=1 FL=1
MCAQIRQNLEPQPVARTIRQVIGGIMAWHKVAFLAIPLNLLPRHAQQRADVTSGCRTHRRQAIGACATQDAHEYGLCLVIGMMSRCQDICTGFFPGLPQETIPQRARRQLKGKSFSSGKGRHISGLHQAGNA